jgi:hypothetical protein
VKLFSRYSRARYTHRLPTTACCWAMHIGANTNVHSVMLLPFCAVTRSTATRATLSSSILISNASPSPRIEDRCQGGWGKDVVWMVRTQVSKTRLTFFVRTVLVCEGRSIQRQYTQSVSSLVGSLLYNTKNIYVLVQDDSGSPQSVCYCKHPASYLYKSTHSSCYAW